MSSGLPDLNLFCVNTFTYVNFVAGRGGVNRVLDTSEPALGH